MTNTSAAAVSARLRKAGFGIVATRMLEGIRVSKGVLGEVHVVVDHDMPGSARRVAELVAAELDKWEGYEYRRHEDVHFYIKKKVPTDRAELAEIIFDGASISRNEADHIAGMIIAAGYTRK